MCPLTILTVSVLLLSSAKCTCVLSLTQEVYQALEIVIKWINQRLGICGCFILIMLPLIFLNKLEITPFVSVDSCQSCVTVMTRDFPITVFYRIVTVKEQS